MNHSRQPLKILVLGLLISCLVGCQRCEESISPIALIKKTGNNKFTLVLTGHRCLSAHGLGSKSLVEQQHYLVVERRLGRFAADEIRLNYETDSYLAPQSALRGFLLLDESRLSVSLQVPFYADGHNIDSYSAYRYNGNFTLKHTD